MKEPQKRQPTEIRQVQIKEAVLEIISEEGLHSLSTRNVAKKVGISEGALFRHFSTKRDIFLAIMDDVQTQLMRDLKRIATAKISASERLYKFLCAHIHYLLDNKGITILLFTEATHMDDAELKSRLKDVLLNQKQYVSKIIQDGIVDGFWDSEISVSNVAMLYMGIPIALNIELILNPAGLDMKNFCKKMVCLLERALKKE